MIHDSARISPGLLDLNGRAAAVFEAMRADAAKLGIRQHDVGGATVLDCGVEATAGIEAGLRMARLCLADLAEVSVGPDSSVSSSAKAPRVCVRTDQPVAACLASQYAGWKIAVGDFFGMGSGPMRAVANKEEIFEKIGYRETAKRNEPTAKVVGVLETSQRVTEDVVSYICEACQVSPNQVFLAAAPTTSIAGCLQIAARSVETALHKLEQLDFDLTRIKSGFGSAPLPDPTPDFVEAIGRTNDAILYDGAVTLWVSGDDASLEETAPRVPSSASADSGRPFAEIFRAYDGDFYKIDPLLFSPAMVRFVNIETGNAFTAGELQEQ